MFNKDEIKNLLGFLWCFLASVLEYAVGCLLGAQKKTEFSVFNSVTVLNFNNMKQRL